MSVERLTITRLGQRGEGVASSALGPVYVPYVLPDETITADVDGEGGHLIDLVIPRADRIVPICPSFGRCGGCNVQALPPEPYGAWKRDLVVDAFRKVHIAAAVEPLIDAHGVGRRRATFHARAEASPNVLKSQVVSVGFMRARSHDIIDLTECPILAPAMGRALSAARRLASIARGLQKPLDLLITASDSGLDIDLRGLGVLDPRWTRSLVDEAAELDLARLSNHGHTLIERRAPTLRMGNASVLLPPGAFLQATAKGETVLSDLVLKAVGNARKVADLFCGLGPFALRLAEQATVRAVDIEGPSLSALSRAARAVSALRPVSIEGRDLFRRPLSAKDLDGVDAVVFDPPRSGASAQAEALASSRIGTVVAVSCAPATLARDAAILVGGGYRLDAVTPVDQFRYSSHVEVVAVFRRTQERKRPARALFG